MNQQRSRLGPRGYALLILAGGAGLAWPFMRPAAKPIALDKPFANVLVQDVNAQDVKAGRPVAGEPMRRQASAHSVVSTGLLNHESVSPADQVPDANMIVEHAQPQADFPVWAQRPSRLDDLLDTVGPSAPNVISSHVQTLESMQTWRAESPDSFNSSIGQNEPLAAARHSPWQNAVASDAVATEPATDATQRDPSRRSTLVRGSGIDWQPEIPNLSAELINNPSVGTPSMPFGLARATLRAGDHAPHAAFDSKSSQANPEHHSLPRLNVQQQRVPKFVYQPGLQP